MAEMADYSMNYGSGYSPLTLASMPGSAIASNGAANIPGYGAQANWASGAAPNSFSTAVPTQFTPDPQLAAATGQMDLMDQIKNGFGGGGQGSMFDGFLGKRMADGSQVQGWGGMALGGIQGAANLFMGMKQYGLAKDQLAESKKQFELNYGNQRQMTNTRLEDRQAARVASNPGAYQSVGAYMAKNGIK